MLTNKEIEKVYLDKAILRVKCKCGHTNTILDKRGYKLCNWCHNYVFLDKQKEFKYRIRELYFREKRRQNEI